MRKLLRHGMALGFALLLTVGLTAGAFAYGHAAGSSGIDSFDASAEGNRIALSFSGDAWWIQADILTFAYADGKTETFKLEVGQNGPVLKTTDWKTVSTDGSIRYTNGSKFDATLYVPVSALHSTDFTMTFAGGSMSSAEMGFSAAAEQPKTPEGPDTPAAEQPETPAGPETPADEQPAAPTELETPAAEQPTAPAQGGLTPDTAGKIEVDGELEDWKNVAGAKIADDPDVTEWKAARDTAGNVYLCVSGRANEYDTSKFIYKIVTLNDRDEWGQRLDRGVSFYNIQNNISGGAVAYRNEGNHNTKGPFRIEAMIPASYFRDADYTLSFGGSVYSAQQLPVMDGVKPAEEKKEAVYDGIAIDGSYADWDAVAKYDAKDPGGTIESMAMVFDGDAVYIYLKEVEHTNGAYNSGSHGNSKFSISTDLGNELLFSLNENGTVNGIEDVDVRHVGALWEIKIPKKDLPEYINSLSLGLYMTEPTVTGVTNLDGSGSGGSFGGAIEVDGLYGDWAYYPHHNIEYATAGTTAEVRDANGALYSANGTLYGHVYTVYENHTENDKGHEFTSGVTIRFNGRDNLVFHPMNLTADANGNLNWNPQKENLPDGTYRFILADTNGWSGADSFPTVKSLDEYINEWIQEDAQHFYGVMYVTVKEGRDECEFYLDLAKIAKKLKIDETDMKTIEAQFINIGTQWLVIAGSSSGPVLGVALSCAAVLGVTGYRRRRSGERA